MDFILLSSRRYLIVSDESSGEVIQSIIGRFRMEASELLRSIEGCIRTINSVSLPSCKGKASQGESKLEGKTFHPVDQVNLEPNEPSKTLRSIEATSVPRKIPAWLPGPFKKREAPIFTPSLKGLDNKNVYNMAVIKENGAYRMLYRGESKGETAKDCTGRLFLASSSDGIHWHRMDKPVLVPEHWYEAQGVEDPRLVKIDDTYYLTYTGYDGKLARLCLATSKDLLHWHKIGPIFPKFPVPKGNLSPDDWTKSGAILPERIKSGPWAGKYIMYFGESNLWLGYSDDLIHWKYVKEPVLRPREGKFDSLLVEPGPPPIMTKDGILLIYNGAKSVPYGNSKRRYCTGAVIFDPEDPTRVKERVEEPFIEPTLPWEKKGYVDNVVFSESLVREDDKWRIYYGGADHVIGVAEAEVEDKAPKR